MAGAFCLGLVPPPILRLRWQRTHDNGLQEAMADLVRATSAQDVAGGLLPHIAGYVGAYAAAVFDADGNLIAGYGAVPDGAGSLPGRRRR